jgi:oxygen-dependent protoporphyrinogen oxidase
LVIGGGISGLTCAHRLKKEGFAVQLLESAMRLGGVLNTVEKEGFRFDIGPQSFLPNPPLSDLIEELGLTSELLRADPRAPRYILLNGRLIEAPLGPLSLLRTPLIGARTKLRLLWEPIGHTVPPEEDESIAAFVRRKFGEDLLENLAGPFISGIYAGDPEKLSLDSAFPVARQLEDRFGSLARGALKMRRQAKRSAPKGPRQQRPSLCNFRKGTVTLVDALAKSLADSARTAVSVTAIRRSAPEKSAEFEADCQIGAATYPVNASAIILAAPAPQAAALLAATSQQFHELLSKIEYAPVAQVAAGYRLSQIARFTGFPPRGFGFLVPRTQHLRLLGTVWNSFLFAGRVPEPPEAPEKMASFTSFVGGATDPAIATMGESEIGRLVHAELAAVLGINGVPVEQHVARWERALPQYNVGHKQVVATLAEQVAATPGIFLTGNYLAGPSLGSCVDHANKTAEAVTKFLRPQS